jgi:hypothetical protein
MGLHTDYLGHVRIDPVLSPAEVDFLKGFNRTRHCGERAPLDVAEHPTDNEPTSDVRSYNRASPGMPGLWCPWTCCDEGCCLCWDGREKPYAPDQWLAFLLATFLCPGAALADDPTAQRLGLTFDHVLNGVLVGERRETTELFALDVVDNVVVRRTLLAGRDGEWGYGSERREREDRRRRLAARRARFAAALEQDLRRPGCCACLPVSMQAWRR